MKDIETLKRMIDQLFITRMI